MELNISLEKVPLLLSDALHDGGLGKRDAAFALLTCLLSRHTFPHENCTDALNREREFGDCPTISRRKPSSRRIRQSVVFPITSSRAASSQLPTRFLVSGKDHGPLHPSMVGRELDSEAHFKGKRDFLAVLRKSGLCVG